MPSGDSNAKDSDLDQNQNQNQSPFLKELEQLINRHSQENQSNTPDFILAKAVGGFLDTLNETIRAREKWYGVEHQPGQLTAKPAAPADEPLDDTNFEDTFFDERY